MTTQTHLPPQWRERLLANCNSRGWNVGTFAPEAMILLDAWQRAEGGAATWNPLNSTLPWAGATNYNSAGVKNYPKAGIGVVATYVTLVNGYYNGILGFLQAPQITASDAVRKYADEFRTWGTNPDTILAVLGS